METSRILAPQSYGPPDATSGPLIRASVPQLDQDFWISGTHTTHVSLSDVEKRPYRYHSWTYGCAQAITKNVSPLPQVLFEKEHQEKEINEHDILSLLDMPNTMMSGRVFRQAIILSLLLPSNMGRVFGGSGTSSTGGQAFIVPWNMKGDKPVDLSKGEVPDELIPFSDAFFKPKLEKEKGRARLVGWTFEIPNAPKSKMEFKTTEIIRIYLYNPYEMFKGMAPYLAAEVAVDQDVRADIFNTRMFETDGRLQGALTTDQFLDIEKKRENMRFWRENYMGLNARSRTAVLDAGLKYEQFGLSLADMQWQEQKELNKEQLLTVFGLNKIAIGDYEQINFATIREGRMLLWYDTYIPMDDLIASALNSQWIQYTNDGKIRLRSDYSQVEALRANTFTKAQTGGVLVEKWGYPPTLAARTVGLPLKEEDVKKWPHLDQQIVKSTPAPQAPPKSAPVKKREINDEPIIVEDERLKRSDAYIERVLQPGENAFNQDFIKFFHAQKRKVLDAIDEWLKDSNKHLIVPARLVFRSPAVDPTIFLFDVEDETTRLMKMYRPNAEGTALKEQAAIKDELGKLIEFNVDDPLISSYTSLRVADMRGVNSTTFQVAREAIGSAVTQGMEENWTVKELAENIKENVRAVYRVRVGDELKPHGKFDLGGMSSSKTIARTEAGMIASHTRFDAFKVEGIDEQEWLTSRDDKVRLVHMDLDGQTAIVGEVFETVTGFVTDLRFPRDYASTDPAQVINCRCVALAVIKE